MNGIYQALFPENPQKNKWWKQPISLGILILMVLPPVGVLWFMGIGWLTLYKRIRRGASFPFNSVTLFFLGIVVSSTVSLVTIRHLSTYVYIPVPLLLLGYLGLYLRIFSEVEQDWEARFSSFTLSMMIGGLYIVFFSLFVKQFHLTFPFPFDYLTGRALLGSPPTERLYGSTYNPNFASYLLLFVVGFTMAYLIRAFQVKSYQWISILILGLLIYGYAIFDTGSRSAFIAMLVIIELFILRFNWKLAGLIVLIILLRFQWFIHMIPRNNIIDLSYNYRIHIWKTSLRIFAEHPLFGVSPAGFSVFYKAITHKYVPHSHDLFLAFLSEYGIVGEAVLLILGVALVRHYSKVVLYHNNKRLYFSASFILTLPVIIFTGILDHPLFSPQVAIPTVLLISFFHRYSMNMKHT